ncbi:hypothetical protein D3C80_1087510 [compost metagenome]
MDHAVVFDHVGAVFRREGLHHRDQSLLRAAADGGQGLGAFQPHAVLVEQAIQQGLGADGRVDQFVVAQGLEQGAGALPDLLGRAARAVAGDDLDHRSAGAPARSGLGSDLTHGQAHLGRHLFRLGEIVFGAQRQAFALDRGDALGALEVLAPVDGHDEDALAQQRPGAGAGEAFGRLGHLVRIKAAEAAHRPRRVVVGHHIAHRTVALGLDDQTALEFQRRADDGGQDAGLAQQGGDGLRIGVGRQDLVHDLAQPHQAAAHGPTFDLEGGGEVIGRSGEGLCGGRVIGHGEDPEKRRNCLEAAQHREAPADW